jgi:DNA-binding TFAR19-related protein (PDSD5 family)
MTTVQITLPDDLAQKASAAGLFSPNTIEHILREQLRRQAADALRRLRASLPREELTPEIEQEIVELVRADRVAHRQQGEH